MTHSIKKESDTLVKACVELSRDDLARAVARAEAALAAALTVDGFRPGNVPLDVARKHLNPDHVRQEALQEAVQGSMADLIKVEQLDVLDQEGFSIKENNADKLVYEIKLILAPHVELGAYKGLKYAQHTVEVKDEEVDKVVIELAAMRKKPDDVVPPAINDDFARSLGKFASLADLRAAIKQGIKMEKEDAQTARMQGELIKQVVGGSRLAFPDLLVTRQLDMLMEQFDAELHARGLELGPYLAKIQKTQDELRASWIPTAREQVSAMLVLHEIARAESITDPDPAIVMQKVFALLESHAIMQEQ